MACAHPEPPDRIHDIIEAMADSLSTFLNPQGFLNDISTINSEVKQNILNTAVYHPKDAMEIFLEWLLDQEDSGHSQMELYKVLSFRGESDFLPRTMISPNCLQKWRSVTDMAKLFVELVDGNKIENVSPDTLRRLMDVLWEQKIIKKRDDKILKQEPLDALMALFKLIKKMKPDWPFIVWSVLEQEHPDLFIFTDLPRLEIENPSLPSFSGLQIENPSICSTVGSSQQRMDDEDSAVENASAVESDSAVENASAVESDSAVENASAVESVISEFQGLHVENPSIEQSDNLNDFSVTSVVKRKSQVPPKKKKQVSVTDVELPGLEKLIDVGAISRQNVTINNNPTDNCKGWRANYEMPDYSDGDTDDEETDLKRPVESQSNLSLRGYQKELAQKALAGKNVIVCAPTGSGKTRVAMHIIIRHLDQSTEAKPKKVCFFARTVPLAVQQHKSISNHLPAKYKSFLLTGDSPYSTNLSAFLPEHDVIVLTPMILGNHFKRGLLPDLTVFTLLVFDECHHTRKSEPYNTLMLSYLTMKFEADEETRKRLPQVLGLTATFPAEKANSNQEAIKSVLQICANLDVQDISTVTEYKDELEKIVPVPIEGIELLRERQGDASVDRIISVMKKLETEAQQYRQVIGDKDVADLLGIGKIPTDKKCQQYNQWAVKLKKAAEMVDLIPRETNMPARLLMIIADYLRHYNVALEAHDLVHLEDVLNYLDASFKAFEENEKNTTRENRFYNYYRGLKKAMESFRHEDNPNLSKLEDVIEEHLIRKGGKSRGIIFVKTRALAEALASWLNRCGKDAIVKLKATIFTGTNASESEGGMTQPQQDACVENFRNGQVRLLIATSVAEEGIDVPECNLVIKYNHVGNEISTIQTRGRSRKEGGRSVLLAMQPIREREIVNRYRAKLVLAAVEQIQAMDATERCERIADLQKEVLREQELDELMSHEAKRRLKDIKFTMFCKNCRQTSVHSDYVKTIFGTHRVVTDWNIWKSMNIRGRDVKYLDDLKFIGSVRCKAFVEKEATCNGPLGMLVVYKATCFLALSVTNFGFVEENSETPQPFIRWKFVPYKIDEIDLSDIKRYLKDSHKDQHNAHTGGGAIGGTATVGDSNDCKQDKVVSREKLGSVVPNGSLDQHSNICEEQGAVGGQVMSSPQGTARIESNIAAKSKLTILSDEDLDDRSQMRMNPQEAEGGQNIPSISAECQNSAAVRDILSKSKLSTLSYEGESKGNESAHLRRVSKNPSILSDLSTYQDDENHHQTKLISDNTIFKNWMKHMNREREDITSCDDDVCTASTTEKNEALKALNNAPSLNSMI